MDVEEGCNSPAPENTCDNMGKIENNSNFEEKENNEKNSESQTEKVVSNDSTFSKTSPPASRELVSRKKSAKGRCFKFF